MNSCSGLTSASSFFFSQRPAKKKKKKLASAQLPLIGFFFFLYPLGTDMRHNWTHGSPRRASAGDVFSPSSATPWRLHPRRSGAVHHTALAPTSAPPCRHPPRRLGAAHHAALAPPTAMLSLRPPHRPRPAVWTAAPRCHTRQPSELPPSFAWQRSEKLPFFSPPNGSLVPSFYFFFKCIPVLDTPQPFFFRKKKNLFTPRCPSSVPVSSWHCHVISQRKMDPPQPVCFFFSFIFFPSNKTNLASAHLPLIGVCFSFPSAQ